MQKKAKQGGAANNLKLTAFMLKMLYYCSRSYDMRCVNSTSALKYQHQLELKQKKSDYLKVPKVDKNNWARTMENIVLHLKLIKELRSFHWLMWCGTMSRWHMSLLDMMLT